VTALQAARERLEAYVLELCALAGVQTPAFRDPTRHVRIRDALRRLEDELERATMHQDSTRPF